MNEDWLLTCCEAVDEIEVARTLWTKEYDLCVNYRKYCGHNRHLKINRPCASMPKIGKCNHKWGCTKFVLLLGDCIKAGVFEKLDKLKFKLPLLQHCTIQKDGKFVVGVYIGNENYKLKSTALFEKLSEM